MDSLVNWEQDNGSVHIGFQDRRSRERGKREILQISLLLHLSMAGRSSSSDDNGSNNVGWPAQIWPERGLDGSFFLR